eukprot:SAG31_NODE_4743_length_2986_cov_4.941808_2_plen_154_part_00
MWEQPNGDGSTFHALFHDHISFGGHAFSRDAMTWWVPLCGLVEHWFPVGRYARQVIINTARFKRIKTFSHSVPYSSVANFAGGTRVQMQRRERPHLVLDDRGYITHLSTGVQPPPTESKSPPANNTRQLQNDHAFTLLQPVSRRQEAWVRNKG